MITAAKGRFAPLFLIIFLTVLSVFPLNRICATSTPDFFMEYSGKLYEEINEPSLNPEAFSFALKGYYYLLAQDKIGKKHLLSIVDYSKPSAENRFFIIDIQTKKLLYKTLVSHGKNSGIILANEFSNEINSNKSSVGFFLTGESYTGKHGLSLRLDGLEEGINNNARNRSIVIHGAEYVCDDFIKNNGRLGRSHGCPALPENVAPEIIELIKEQTSLFIYHPDTNYINTSLLINNTAYLKYIN